MKKLLYKEFKLSIHPTFYLFLLLTAMLLIPAYPYYVAFLYTCLAVFFVFQFGRQNQDTFFTALLPIPKGDVVRARALSVSAMELGNVLVSVPFAILAARLYGPGHNSAGIEANPAFYGLVFLMFGGYNRIFFPTFYRTGDRLGWALLYGGAFIMVYIVLAEAVAQYIPSPLRAYLDNGDPAAFAGQLPVLLGGIVLWILLTWRAVSISVRRFEEVDL